LSAGKGIDGGEGLKNDLIAAGVNFPDFIPWPLFLRQLCTQRVVAQLPGDIRFPIAELTESARIHLSFLIYGQSAYNNFPRHEIRLPMLPVEYQQGIVVGEIHKTFRSAGSCPILVSSFIVALGIILNERNYGKARLLTACQRRSKHRGGFRLYQKQERTKKENQNTHNCTLSLERPVACAAQRRLPAPM